MQKLPLNEMIILLGTSLSSPNKITIKKNNMDHKGATGISATAAGYAINAKPGPDKAIK